MSPEWMIALDRMAGRREHDPLADPLEREEWKGLEWVSRLFHRLQNERREPASRHVARGVFAHDAVPRRF